MVGLPPAAGQNPAYEAAVIFFFTTKPDEMPTRKISVWALAAALLSAACYSEGKLVENPAPLAHYQHRPTEARLLALAKTYAEAINRNLERGTIHPGQYADYGVALARLGCKEQANTMFNNETAFFPNSARYVDTLRRAYACGAAADNGIDTGRIDLRTLDTIPITLTPEETALRQQMEADPEYQKAQKQQQLEEKEEKAKEAQKAKRERAKAKEAERRALAKERDKAQRKKLAERKAAQKEKEKARKAAKKAHEKARRAEQRNKKRNQGGAAAAATPAE